MPQNETIFGIKKALPVNSLIRRIILSSILFFLFFTSVINTTASSNQKYLYNQARKKYVSLIKNKPSQRAKWTKCIRIFKTIYKKNPVTELAVKSMFSAANLYFALNKVSHDNNDLAEAERLYWSLIKKNPKSRFSDDALFNIGKINLRRGDKLKGRKNFQTLLDKYPKGDMRKKASLMVKKLSSKLIGRKTKKSPNKGKKCSIVIDPGHGGKDAGAIGINGIMEKDIILDISTRLKKKMEKKDACEIIMTREKDIFIPLKKRTAIANSVEATLFVSIHANASKNKNVAGIETYFQGLPKTLQEKETAARENMVAIKREFSTKDDMLGFILSDMNNTYLINESSHFAELIQTYLIKGLKLKFSGIKDLGVKQALFYVLHDARMPSILLEVSFLTNQLEGKRLGNKKYREAIATYLYNGINAYLKNALNHKTQLSNNK